VQSRGEGERGRIGFGAFAGKLSASYIKRVFRKAAGVKNEN
jgi:hypothetical protein